MSNSLHSRRVIVALATAVWLIATAPTHAAEAVTPYTATGHCTAVCYAGDTLALEGTSQLRNHLHIVKVEAAEARIAGRRTFLMNGIANTNGTMRIYGSWHGELGTWTGGLFTPTSGVWDGSWNGTNQADGRFSVSLVGRGSGGPVEDLQLEETATRAAGTPNDPAIPIGYTGRVGPEDGEWHQVLFSDQFEDGQVAPWSPVESDPSHPAELVEVGGSLILTGSYLPQGSGGAFALIDRPYDLIDGQTLELRVDVVRIQNPGNFADIIWQTTAGTYYFGLTDGWVSMAKWFFDQNINADFVVEFLPMKTTNVTLVLSLTAFGQNNIITGQVLDKDKTNMVIFSKTVTDTPAADAVWSGSPIPDRAGPAWRTADGGPFLGLASFAGTVAPKTSVTFDNFEVRRYAAPALAIDQAYRVRWPAVDMARVLEGAPRLSGPWSAVVEPVFQQSGLKQVTIPFSPTETMKVFRLK